MKKVLIAPNSFKGSLNSAEVAKSIKRGLKASDLEIRMFPIADGGDDTLPVFVNAFGGELIKERVRDPLGRMINARWGRLKNDVAVIEMAESSGIRLLKNHELDPQKTSTYGTGQLLNIIIKQGITNILLGIGGSATVDAGAGILHALGARFFNKDGKEIENGNLIIDVQKVDFKPCLEKTTDVSITVLTDVDNPLLGKNGAARIFGPQKGATLDMVEKLEERMKVFSDLIIGETGKNYTLMKGMGAAGGIGYAFKSLFESRVMSGMEYLIQNSDLISLIQTSDIIITGEGKLDSQSLKGKGPVQIARLAKKNHKPCIAICGSYEPSEELDSLFEKIFAISQIEPTVKTAMQKTNDLLVQMSLKISDYLNTIKSLS